MEKIIKEIESLIKDGHTKKAKELYEEYKEELDEYLKEFTYQNVNGHKYSGYNRLYLSLFSKPGVYGTFKQWKDNGRKVKKGEKAELIFMPIFYNNDDEENQTIRYMKKLYIFHKDQTEEVARA